MLLGCKSKLEVKYPCKWLYKIIGADMGEIELAIREVIADVECEISPSNSSKTGKYLSVNLEIMVANEAQRTRVYTELKNHPMVKMVL